MNEILKLTSIATGLKGNKIRLGGEVLDVHTIAVHNDNPQRAARMVVELSLHDPQNHVTTCDCSICKTRALVNDAGAGRVFSLISEGRYEKLVLDSSTSCDGSFTVKIRNTSTRRCDVGEGPSLIIAAARATKKALNV